MKRRILNVILVSLAWAAVTSCRVFEDVIFEDRKDCPVWVVVKAEPAWEPGGERSMSMHVWKDGAVQRTENAGYAELNEGYMFQLKKGRYGFSGISGWADSGSLAAPALLVVGGGEEYPPLYAFGFREEEFDGEVQHVTDEVWQLFFNVRVNATGAKSRYTYRCVAYGAHDGYAYPSLEVHRGEYGFVMHEEDYYHRYGRFPRQGGFSSKAEGKDRFGIRFDFYEPETGAWMEMLDLDLSVYCAEYGYDWDARTLEDVDVNIKLANGGLVSAEIVISDWHKVIMVGDDGNGYVI